MEPNAVERQFSCPKGCLRRGKPVPLNTLRGWKRHMSVEHGGYSDEELRAATQGAGEEGAHLSGSPSLKDFTATLPEKADAPAPQPGAAPGAAPAPNPELEKERARRVRAEKITKQMRDTISAMPGQLFDTISDLRKEPGWKLSDKEQERIADAISLCLEALPVEFEVQPYVIRVDKPLWFLLFPIAVLLFVFGAKAVAFGLPIGEEETEKK